MDHLDGTSLDVPVLGILRSLSRNATSTAVTRQNLTPRTKLVLEILMVLMCLGAVTGNILVIGIVAATKTFHSVTSVLIINLAISDLLVGIGVMPFVAVSIMNNSWVNCTDLCLYVGYTSSVYCTASVLTLAAIALDRYHSIVDCLRYSSRCTLGRTFAVVLWIWLQALVTSCPPLLGWSSVSYVGPMYSCAVNWANSPSYTAFMAALSFLVPAAVIVFCYVNIVRVARGHARRIHDLEEHLHRHRNPASSSTASSSASDSTSQHCGGPHGSSRLVYHLSGRFVSAVHGEGTSEDTGVPSSGAPQSSSSFPPRRLFSFWAQGGSQPPHQPQQHHHGLLRLFMVIAAFFLCWTPYIGVALVQATETALAVESSLVPPSAITFSYWLVLLNSDINPLLYALLSKRFKGALQSLRQKIRARLGKVVVRGRAVREATLPAPRPGSRSQALGREESNYDTSVFTVNSKFSEHSKERLCEVYLPGSASSSCSLWQEAGEEGGSLRRLDCLQVPSRTQEGSRLPFSAATKERQATFFYGQITVRVEHDVC
ncbi:5-hydroxytryptamine receptor 1D [Aplochiton taeniatus]